jgi:hypothetical protein
MEKISLNQFFDRLRQQGVPREHVAFRCPICGTVQSMAALILAGAGSSEDEVEGYVGFSCIGRWTNAGPHLKGTPPGRGCDWTLGGLFRIHKLVVITEDQKEHARFEIATPDEARALMAEIANRKSKIANPTGGTQ